MKLARLSSVWKYFGAALVIVMHSSAMCELRGFSEERAISPKTELQVQSEDSITRRRVQISQRVTEQPGPVIKQLADVDFERARKYKIDEKTNELIKQLEDLSRRQGQRKVVGELKMRLAELYFSKGQSLSAEESEDWEGRVKIWEALPEGEKSKKPRPQLKTPKADAYRKRTLGLYTELEQMSRGADKGKSQSIRREEVLFFLASTMMDLGQRKQAAPYYEELVKQYSGGERIFAARMNLADLDFEMGRYEQAIPLYLEVATGRGAPKGEDAGHLKAYGLYKLGWCYMNIGQHSKAVLAFKRTAEVARASGNDRRIVLEKEAMNDLARAFALAGQFEEGEKYYSALGESADEAFQHFRQESASIARDNGRFDVALRYYGQLIEKDPAGEQAREYAMERLQILSKRGNVKAYQSGLEEFAKSYGNDSNWMSTQTEETKKAMTEELVSLLRREAKNTHRAAQQKDKAELYAVARQYYELYFKFVPAPNADTTANVQEMKFYQAELYYKLGLFAQAADAYAVVSEGKYASQASYSRILALKQGAKQDKNLAKVMIEATDQFVEKFPQDERAGDLLYSSAQEAFNTGDNKQSVAALDKVVQRFDDKKTGVEAAERILFILEKEGDVDGAVARSEQFLQNKKLLAAGGGDFEKRLREISERAEFKKAENIKGNDAIKADSFLAIAKKTKGEVREKALNNAAVFAKTAKATETLHEAQKMLLAEFPNSPYSKGLYAALGDSAAETGKWSEALKSYNAYLKTFGDKKNAETEAMEWNRLFILGSLEDVWVVELYPARAPSAEVLKLARAFVEKYPRSKNRARIVEMLAMRRGSSKDDLTKLRHLPALTGDELSVVKDAEVVVAVRESADLEALVRRHPPGKATSSVLKHGLALSAFRLIEPRYKNYLQLKLNYTPKMFGKTLKNKLDALEKIEKEYMGVVAYGNGEWALKSLDRLSSTYRSLASDIDRAPTNKEELAQFSKPLFDKGVGFLKTCLDKGAELKIGGEGLQTCRSAASKLGATFVTITDDVIPQPKWVPIVDGLKIHPLLLTGVAAIKAGRYGEANLAQDLLTKDEATLSSEETSVLELLRGLSNLHYKSNDAATRNFRKASESTLPSVKAAAFKNLTALYLEVSDFAQASDAAQALGDQDADAALLSGLAARGKGQNDVALLHYEAGLKLAPNSEDLLFNSALVNGALGHSEQAAVHMARYVEMRNPSQNDISRDLLKRYKQKGEQK